MKPLITNMLGGDEIFGLLKISEEQPVGAEQVTDGHHEIQLLYAGDGAATICFIGGPEMNLSASAGEDGADLPVNYEDGGPAIRFERINEGEQPWISQSETILVTRRLIKPYSGNRRNFAGVSQSFAGASESPNVVSSGLTSARFLDAIAAGEYVMPDVGGMRMATGSVDSAGICVRGAAAGGLGTIILFGGGERKMAYDEFTGLAYDAGCGANFSWSISIYDIRNKPPVPVNALFPHLYIYDVTAAPPGLIVDGAASAWTGIGVGLGLGTGLLPGERYTVEDQNIAATGVELSYTIRIGEGDPREYVVVSGVGNVLTLTWAGRAPLYTAHIANEFIGGRLIPDTTASGSYEITANAIGGANFTVTVDPADTDLSGVTVGATARIIPPGSGSDIAVLGAIRVGDGLTWDVGQSG